MPILWVLLLVFYFAIRFLVWREDTRKLHYYYGEWFT